MSGVATAVASEARAAPSRAALAHVEGEPPRSDERAGEAPVSSLTGWSFASVPPAPPADDGVEAGWRRGARPPADVVTAASGPGRPLSGPAATVRRRGVDPGRVRIHTDAAAASAARSIDADAYTLGTHIVFGAGRFDPTTDSGRELLRHELGHVAQSRSDAGSATPTMVDDERSEEAAWARGPGPLEACVDGAVQRAWPGRVIKWALKRLDRETAELISKHVAKHTRAIANRAIHTVFRNPRAVKPLVTSTLREAGEVVARRGSKAAVTAIEEVSIRVVRQTTGSPGKFRWVVQKTFGKAIGTRGERVLRIVLDQTGRLVTAFPADRLIAIGIGVGAVEALTDRTADAAEGVQASLGREAELLKAAAAAAADAESSWWDWVPIIGDIWGGSPGAGESQVVEAGREREKRERMVADTVAAVIDDLQKEQQRTFGPEMVAEITEYVRMIIVSGADLESDEEPGDTGPGEGGP